MSVIVKGVNISARCLDCKFMVISRDNDDCVLQSYEQNEKAESWDELKANCPLLDIPSEHGRLIDADALWMDIIHSMDYCEDILEFIENMPTIAPAERSDQ